MASRINSRYYTLDKIPKHRLELINSTLEQFISEYSIEKWPIDCVELIKRIENEKHIKLQIISTIILKEHEDAKTIYVPDINTFLIAVNKKKIHYPYITSQDRRLNFTLAHELGHIYLKHNDLPDNCKDDLVLEQEGFEADEFAGRLLIPEEFIASCNYTCISQVAKIFKVSESAILKRLSNLNREDLNFNKKINNWDSLRFALFNDDKEFISNPLENCTSKQYGDTRSAYVNDVNIKGKLNKQAYMALIKSNAMAEFSDEISDLEIIELEETSPNAEEPEIDDFDLPF